MIFLAFLVLSVVSVGVTFAGLAAQKQDGRVINLAGRERMLLQQMARLALGVEYEGNGVSRAALLESADSFEQALLALRGGGQITDYTGERFEIAPPADPALRAELDALQSGWQGVRAEIDRLLAAPAGTPQTTAAVKAIEALLPDVVEQADRVTRAFETASTARITRLRTLQVGFLLGGLALISTGWWFTRRSVVKPLATLERSAQRIGEGDLSQPVRPEGPTEVQVLAGTMDTMRAQLLASREDLQGWAETLESRVQQRTRELEALAAVSREISSHLSIGKLLESVAEKARTLLGSEVASLCLLDEAGKLLSLHAAAGPEAAIRANQSPADNPQVGQVLHQPAATPCGLYGCHGFCQIIEPGYRASHLAAPLYSREKVIGALCVGSSRPGAFRPEMEPVLTQLAGVAAVALENSRLYQQAEYAATLEERQRIASEMHDGLLQTLSFLRLMVRMTEEQILLGDREKAALTLQQIDRAEQQAEGEIRRAIASLQDDFPLNDTLQERLSVLAQELSKTAPLVGFETEILLPLILPRQESEQVLRVAREAILNAQRYSQAESVRLGLEKDGTGYVLTVQDAGVGFNPEGAPDDGRAHFGMKIMQARAARLGGTLTIDSAPGAGTTVRLCWTPSTKQTP